MNQIKVSDLTYGSILKLIVYTVVSGGLILGALFFVYKPGGRNCNSK